MNKQIILNFIFILGIVYLSIAQNYITLDHNGTPSLYTSLSSAVSNAQDGDYIYIPGGTFYIGTLQISKEVHIFGVGHYADSAVISGRTYLSGSIVFLTGADSSSISGFYLSGGVVLGTTEANQVVNNLLITRCNIGYLQLAYSWSSAISTNSQYIYVTECVIRDNLDMGSYAWDNSSVFGANAKNCLFEKNIIEGCISYFNNYVHFNNNIILQRYWGYGVGNVDYHVFREINNAHFSNNVIFDWYGGCGQAYPILNLNNCVFYNCLFLHEFPSWFYSYFSCSNQAINCIFSQSQSSIFQYQSGFHFNYDHDYHLKPTCAGVGAGTDGTDIGIYGTLEPYKEGAVPVIPKIQSFGFGNNATQIQVDIRVDAQDK